MTAPAHIKGSNLKTIYLQRETIYKMDAIKMKENFASRPSLKLLLC